METLFLLTEILTVVFKNNVYYIRMLCNNFLWLTWPSLLTKDGDDAHASKLSRSVQFYQQVKEKNFLKYTIYVTVVVHFVNNSKIEPIF